MKCFKLYQDYKDVLKMKIVSIVDLDAAGNTLAVNTYIEKKKQEIVAPEIVRAQYSKHWKMLGKQKQR